MTWWAVRTVLLAQENRAYRAAAAALPDAMHHAALTFAYRFGLLQRTGQRVRLTRAGRRYLRAYQRKVI